LSKKFRIQTIKYKSYEKNNKTFFRTNNGSIFG
jgi:hypothetical protein